MQQALRGRLARVPAPQQVRPRTRAAARVRPSAAGVLRRVRPPPPARLRVEAEGRGAAGAGRSRGPGCRSEEHTSELQSLMRSSYAVFCLNKKKNNMRADTKTAHGH